MSGTNAPVRYLPAQPVTTEEAWLSVVYHAVLTNRGQVLLSHPVLIEA
ncbi:MAG: hypothetical protein PUH68_01690 [Bacteroidales bacterium]|nr:hypothetical protein [Bacteroidales bacterium]